MASGSDGIRKNLNSATELLRKASEGLASGKKSFRDNPAASAVAAALEADAAQINVSKRNVADGSSLINTFESSYGQVGNILGRLSELATQSANGTLSDDQRAALNEEFTQLKDEVERQLGSTEFNGIKPGDQVSIQVGSNSEQLSVSTGDPAALTSSISSLDISTKSAAESALSQISQATQSVNALRGNFGAAQSRLESAGSNLESQHVATKEAASRIQDYDVAQGVADRTAALIRQQGAVFAQQSHNTTSQAVLRLLS